MAQRIRDADDRQHMLDFAGGYARGRSKRATAAAILVTNRQINSPPGVIWLEDC
jgi:hypothetical protein